MRSRYTAYTLCNHTYLLETWHPSTRPEALDLEPDTSPKWIGLQIKRHVRLDENHSEVEFVARYRIGGRAHRLHEISRFVQEDGRWRYVDGDIQHPHGPASVSDSGQQPDG
jgi:SEC-C motif domain protein